MLKTKYHFFTSGLILYLMPVCFSNSIYSFIYLNSYLLGVLCVTFDSDMLRGTVSQIASLIIHSKVNIPVS